MGAGERLAAWSALAGIVLLGLVLRVVGASGDPWLDEIWSLDLVSGLTTPVAVLWRINHDNNHFLNSAWLVVTGPDASPLVHRALSIAFGVATPVAAMLVTADRGRTTQVAAGLLFAVSYPLVHYGSEARGYSGLVLFTLLSILFVQRSLDGRRGDWLLAAAILLGFLSHLTMLGSVIVLVAWTLWSLFRRSTLLAAVGGTIAAFLPAAVLVAQLAMGMALAASVYGFAVGGSTPYTLHSFLTGYGGLIRHLFGVPGAVPDAALIAAAGILVSASAWFWPDRRASLYVIGVVGLPLLMMQMRLPNLEFPRYFLTSGVLLLLWAADVVGRSAGQAGAPRIAAATAMTAILAGNALSLLNFYQMGRGSPAAVVDAMTRAGPAAYAADHAFRTGMTVDFFARRLGHEARLVTAEDWCAERPAWLVVETRKRPAEPREAAPGCDLAYDLVQVAPVWGLSGIPWALYRLDD